VRGTRINPAFEEQLPQFVVLLLELEDAGNGGGRDRAGRPSDRVSRSEDLGQRARAAAWVVHGAAVLGTDARAPALVVDLDDESAAIAVCCATRGVVAVGSKSVGTPVGHLRTFRSIRGSRYSSKDIRLVWSKFGIDSRRTRSRHGDRGQQSKL
jgi:hypothetical protein